MSVKRPYIARAGLALAVATAVAMTAADAPPDPAVGTSYLVPYRVTQTNHFLVRVRINGKGPFNFLVDTGAPALYVGTECAKAVGLEASKDDFWTPIKRLEFEGGAALTDVKARLEDPFQLTSMNALGLPGARIDGILGFTMLARFKIELDPTKDRMVWTRLNYEPKEPFVPRNMSKRRGPADVEALNMMGPVAKGLAFLIGKQEEDKLIPRGRLGVILEGATGSANVAGVVEGSPAAAAGLKAGDVFISIGSKPADTVKEAAAAIAELRPGKSVVVKVRRGVETIETDVVAGEGF